MKLARIFLAVPALAVLSLTHADAAPKPTPTPAAPKPTPTPTATATPIPAATAAAPAAEEAPPTYNGQQQADYIQQAGEAFLQLRTAKSQPFLEANNALEGAGGLSAKGLDSKATVAERRAMLAKTQAANEDYKAFTATQEDTYRAELAKTPLTPADVDSIVKRYAAEQGNTAKLLKLRTDEAELLKTGDQMLAKLESSYGSWSADGNRPRFKKPADQNGYAALQKKYNALAVDMQKVRAELNPPKPSPSPAGSPTAGAGTRAVPSPTVAVP